MSGYTKGPWVASNYYSDATTILDNEGFSVADAPRCLILEGYSDKGFQHWADSEEAHRWISEEEQRANANLIAAAPDLLKELEETYAALCFTSDYIGSERYKRNIAAIAKALGNH